MILNYVKSQSSVCPQLVDMKSSKTTVYLRKNVIGVETEYGVMYEYDEAKLTKAEYKQYLEEIAATDSANSITDLQLALTEIYEMMLGGI